VQFLFGGYSWLTKEFRLWTIYYDDKGKRFQAREAVTFHPNLQKAAFIGDKAREFRGKLVKELNVLGKLWRHVHGRDRHAYLEPLKLLATELSKADTNSTIGGPPQIIRVTQHMNTRPLCVRWKNEDTLFGRPLFPYENTDYWSVDPLAQRYHRPRK